MIAMVVVKLRTVRDDRSVKGEENQGQWLQTIAWHKFPMEHLFAFLEHKEDRQIPETSLGNCYQKCTFTVKSEKSL